MLSNSVALLFLGAIAIAFLSARAELVLMAFMTLVALKFWGFEASKRPMQPVWEPLHDLFKFKWTQTAIYLLVSFLVWKFSPSWPDTHMKWLCVCVNALCGTLVGTSTERLMLHTSQLTPRKKTIWTLILQAWKSSSVCSSGLVCLSSAGIVILSACFPCILVVMLEPKAASYKQPDVWFCSKRHGRVIYSTYHFISIMQFFVSKSLHFSLIVQTRPCSNMSVNILSVKFSGAWGHKGPHSRLASHSSNSTRSKLQLCSLPKLCGPKSWKLMSLAKRLWCAEQRLQPIQRLVTSREINADQRYKDCIPRL